MDEAVDCNSLRPRDETYLPQEQMAAALAANHVPVGQIEGCWSDSTAGSQAL